VARLTLDLSVYAFNHNCFFEYLVDSIAINAGEQCGNKELSRSKKYRYNKDSEVSKESSNERISLLRTIIWSMKEPDQIVFMILYEPEMEILVGSHRE
jgi:hypothetical protein